MFRFISSKRLTPALIFAKLMIVINTCAWSPIIAAAIPFIYLGRQLKEEGSLQQGDRKGQVTEKIAGEGRDSDERNQRAQWESPELAKLRCCFLNQGKGNYCAREPLISIIFEMFP